MVEKLFKNAINYERKLFLFIIKRLCVNLNIANIIKFNEYARFSVFFFFCAFLC